MLAGELITNTIIPLSPSDDIKKALERMVEFCVKQLPLVQQNKYVGLVLNSQLSEATDSSTLIRQDELLVHNTFVYENQHVYDAINVITLSQLSLVAVLNDKNDFLGVITPDVLLKAVAALTASHEPGGIIILEINNRDNSLAHIAQIVESENTQILSSYIRSFPESVKLEVTLKLNKIDISNILSSFNRYGYLVKATFNDTKPEDSLFNRYEQLMNYLNI